MLSKILRVLEYLIRKLYGTTVDIERIEDGTTDKDLF